jgi:hypothetical protein
MQSLGLNFCMHLLSTRATRFAHVIILFRLITLLTKGVYNFFLSFSHLSKYFLPRYFSILKRNARTHHMNFYTSPRSYSFSEFPQMLYLDFSERRTVIHSQYVHSLQDCHRWFLKEPTFTTTSALYGYNALQAFNCKLR